MDFRRSSAAVIALWCALGPGGALAQKLDKDDKKWLEDVQPLILPDEEKTYRQLKEKADRQEFQKIFWARRDATPDTPQNEFQEAFVKAKAAADTQFRVAGSRGSETDCGRVFILLGKPDEMKAEGVSESAMLRPPETWVFRDRPGQTFAGGEARISFAGNCELPQGNRLGEALIKAAESKIVNTNLGYKQGPDGRLIPLADQKPKPSPTQTLLTTPRQDFPLTVERRMFMRPPSGNTYVAFTVQAPPGTVTPSKVIVSAVAKEAGGALTPTPDREINTTAGPDGSFTGSLGMTLAPGKWDVTVALFDPASGKGSVATVPVTVADPTLTDVAVSTIALKNIQEGATPKPTDALNAFTFGTTVFEPGKVYSPADSLLLLSFLYGGVKDEAGKTSVSMSMAITKDGKTVGKLDDQKFATPASPTIGPIPLTTYAPGTYTVDVKVKDEVGKKEYTDRITFEVKEPAKP